MISDEVLRVVLVIFFCGQGLLHFLFGNTLKKYAVEAGLLNADIAVKMSGALLMLSSMLLFFPAHAEKGFWGLCLFLILSSFILHKFWAKNLALEQFTELLHFGKNILLVFILLYLKSRIT